MSRKVQLRLLSSTLMSEKGEDNLIRFPKRAREYFGFSNNAVVLGKGEYQTDLHAKQAHKGDVQRLVVMIRRGRLTDEQANSVGFVTHTVQQRINRKEGNIWISQGVGSITIGADPEFGLVRDGGSLRRGSSVLPHNGEFGSDGPSVEVRPSPSCDHLVVVERIGEILKNPPEAVEHYRWVGGATYKDTQRIYWFGGHIHLGRPKQVEEGTAYAIYQRIATVLDSLLALPMCRFDTPEPHRRRKGCKYQYGIAGDIRADYPEQDRFEYRVLSGLWLVHPTLARIALGAAKCITETAYGRMAEKGFDPDWITPPASRKGLLKSFGLQNIRGIRGLINKARPEEITEEHIKNWKKGLKKLDFFDEYSAELNALIALTDAGPAKFDLDVRSNWYDKKPLLPRAGVKLRRALEAVEEK